MNTKQFEIYARMAQQRFEFSRKVARIFSFLSILAGGSYAYYLYSIQNTTPQNYVLAIPVVFIGLFLFVAYRQGGFAEKQLKKNLEILRSFAEAGNNN